MSRASHSCGPVLVLLPGPCVVVCMGCSQLGTHTSGPAELCCLPIEYKGRVIGADSELASSAPGMSIVCSVLSAQLFDGSATPPLITETIPDAGFTAFLKLMIHCRTFYHDL